VDLSPLIFVALAKAWAVYEVPQALKHHDEVVRSRSVDRFSHTMRVLARREPVSRTSSRLVVAPGRVPSAPVVTTKASSAPTPEATAVPAAVAPTTAVPAVPLAVRREAARRAARRRRRVLLSLVLGLAVVVTLAATHVLVWASVAVPAVLLVAWLVACRLMVRREHAAPGGRTTTVVTDVPVSTAEVPGDADDTSSIPVVRVEVAEHVEVAATTHVPTPRDPAPAAVEPGLWEPLPVTLPTYVSKPAAERRSVRTIDLDATGVWTSGRTESDAALVREAEQRARADEGDAAGHDRAVGS
jgi:hypothetical protein